MVGWSIILARSAMPRLWGNEDEEEEEAEVDFFPTGEVGQKVFQSYSHTSWYTCSTNIGITRATPTATLYREIINECGSKFGWVRLL